MVDVGRFKIINRAQITKIGINAPEYTAVCKNEVIFKSTLEIKTVFISKNYYKTAKTFLFF